MRMILSQIIAHKALDTKGNKAFSGPFAIAIDKPTDPAHLPGWRRAAYRQAYPDATLLTGEAEREGDRVTRLFARGLSGDRTGARSAHLATVVGAA
jgi:hypothetical protein